MNYFVDLESGKVEHRTFNPGQTHEENAIGVGFIKKVC
jgi:hypothetical protein